MLWCRVFIVLVAPSNADMEIGVKWTSQSSDYIDPNNVVYYSKRAVDKLHNKCSHTKRSIGNWWRIDLGGVYTISCVSIFNKVHFENRLGGAQIYIGNSKEKNGTASPMRKNISNFLDNEINNFTFKADVSGRYITVFSPEEKHLILCEVKIFGKLKESPFKLIRKNKTWADALDHCRDNGYETLASIVDEETQTWAELEADKSSTSFVWVGLRYTCSLDFWFWVEDLCVKFTRWAPGSKIEECNTSGAIEKRGNNLWSSECADTKLNFICKKECRLRH
ncbi:uncharacterized protein AB9W97_016891 isoform 2-T3 [Spinachia spinachia]